MDHAYEGRVPTKQLAAMVASQPTCSNAQTWYTDSGASSHFTPDLANLSLHNEYHSKDQVTVGNCSGQNDKEYAFPCINLRQLRNKDSTPFAFVGVRVSQPVWHHRLGHPVLPSLAASPLLA